MKKRVLVLCLSAILSLSGALPAFAGENLTPQDTVVEDLISVEDPVLKDDLISDEEPVLEDDLISDEDSVFEDDSISENLVPEDDLSVSTDEIAEALLDADMQEETNPMVIYEIGQPQNMPICCDWNKFLWTFVYVVGENLPGKETTGLMMMNNPRLPGGCDYKLNPFLPFDPATLGYPGAEGMLYHIYVRPEDKEFFSSNQKFTFKVSPYHTDEMVLKPHGGEISDTITMDYDVNLPVIKVEYHTHQNYKKLCFYLSDCFVSLGDTVAVYTVNAGHTGEANESKGTVMGSNPDSAVFDYQTRYVEFDSSSAIYKGTSNGNQCYKIKNLTTGKETFIDGTAEYVKDIHYLDQVMTPHDNAFTFAFAGLDSAHIGCAGGMMFLEENFEKIAKKTHGPLIYYEFEDDQMTLPPQKVKGILDSYIFLYSGPGSGRPADGKYIVTMKDTYGNAMPQNEDFVYDQESGTYRFTHTSKMRAFKLPTKRDMYREGFIFQCWKNQNGKKVTKIDKKTNDGDVLTAQWKEQLYSVRYVVPAPARKVKVQGKILGDKKIPYTTELAIKGNELSASGYRLAGWSTSKKDPTLEFTVGQKITGASLNGKKSLVLYAMWEERTTPNPGPAGDLEQYHAKLEEALSSWNSDPVHLNLDSVYEGATQCQAFSRFVFFQLYNHGDNEAHALNNTRKLIEMNSGDAMWQLLLTSAAPGDAVRVGKHIFHLCDITSDKLIIYESNFNKVDNRARRKEYSSCDALVRDIYGANYTYPQYVTIIHASENPFTSADFSANNISGDR